MNDFVPQSNAPNSASTRFPPHPDYHGRSSRRQGRSSGQLGQSSSQAGSFTKETIPTRCPTRPICPASGPSSDYSMWNVAINDIHIFSPHLVNQATFGFNYIVRNQLPHVPSQVTLEGSGRGLRSRGAGAARLRYGSLRLLPRLLPLPAQPISQGFSSTPMASIGFLVRIR